MEANKIIVNGVTRLDLSEDTVTPDDVLQGVSFHSADGKSREGSVVVAPLDDTQASTNSVYSSSKVKEALDNKADKSDLDGKQDSGYYAKSQQWSGNIDELFQQLRYTSGAMGSLDLTKKASGTGSEIPAGWYNVFYSPHRQGTDSSDNKNFGNIILMPMDFTGECWVLRCSSGGVAEVKPLVTGQLNVHNPNLASYSMAHTMSYADLCARNTVTFFTNWFDTTNFPSVYGSGVMLPCLDSSQRNMLFISANGIWVCKVSSNGTKLYNWRELASTSDLDNLGNVVSNLEHRIEQLEKYNPH